MRIMPFIQLIFSIIVFAILAIVTVIAGSVLLITAAIIVSLLLLWWRYKLWQFKRRYGEQAEQPFTQQQPGADGDIIQGEYEVVEKDPTRIADDNNR